MLALFKKQQMSSVKLESAAAEWGVYNFMLYVLLYLF